MSIFRDTGPNFVEKIATGVAAGLALSLGASACSSVESRPPVATATAFPDSETAAPSSVVSSPNTNPAETPNSETNEQEAIQAGLDFAEAPIAERQKVFMDKANEAINATSGLYTEVFTEKMGTTGNHLVTYNPAYRPGKLDDSAEKVLGQNYFQILLARNVVSSDKPDELDIPNALKVLSGVYYSPKDSLGYKDEAGLSIKDYGLLNTEGVGFGIGVSNETGIAFDEKLEGEFPTITDDSGNAYPMHVVRHTTDGKNTVIDVLLLKDGQWLVVDSAVDVGTSTKTWDTVLSNWKQILKQK